MAAADAIRDVRVERTRVALHGALLALLDERPFDGLTVRDLTARAGCGYATFFRHYPDKHALLADVAEREVATLFAALLPILTDCGRRDAALALCDLVDEKRALWKVLLTGGAAGEVREAFLRQGRLAAEAAAPDRAVPAALAIGVGVSGVLEVLGWWLRGDGCDRAALADHLDRLVIEPVLASAAPRARPPAAREPR